MAEEFHVDQRPHPFGESGVRSSLEEVAKRAAEGAVRPEVRTWAIECLDRARKSGKAVNNDRARAEVILQCCQEKLWVPDPVFAEYIPPARLLACNEHGDNGAVCLKGDDCDGLVVLCAAAMMSVGLHCMIVGHAYTREKIIQHVLLLVRVHGEWLYADPSTPEDMPAFPLGRCMPNTRERLLALPSSKVLCDDDVCVRSPKTDFVPEKGGFVQQGVFVGVNGIQEVDPRTVNFSFRWLGEQEVVVPPGGLVRFRREDGEEVVVKTEEATAKKKGWDTSEKLMAAGLVLSIIGLWFDMQRTKK